MINPVFTESRTTKVDETGNRKVTYSLINSNITSWEDGVDWVTKMVEVYGPVKTLYLNPHYSKDKKHLFTMHVYFRGKDEDNFDDDDFGLED